MSSGAKAAGVILGLGVSAAVAYLLFALAKARATSAPSPPPSLKPIPIPIHPRVPSPGSNTLIVYTPDAMSNQVYSVLVVVTDARSGIGVDAKYTRPMSDTDPTAAAVFSGLWPGYYSVLAVWSVGNIEFTPDSQIIYIPPGPPATYTLTYTETQPYPKYICNPLTIKVVDRVGGAPYPADRYYEVYWFYGLLAEVLAFGDRTGPTDTITLYPTKGMYRIKLYSAYRTKPGTMPPQPLLADTQDINLYTKDTFTLTMYD